MKRIQWGILLCALGLLSIAAGTKSNFTEEKEGFTTGNLEIGSMDRLTFGPEGILFIGDTKNAMIYALDTKDVSKKEEVDVLRIPDFDKKIAASLGTTVENIQIKDMAVNPLSKQVYFAVAVTDGASVLLKLNGEELENVSLNAVSHSKIQLADPVDVNAKTKWDNNRRQWAISDMKYHKGKVLMTGLSNKEFSSTFRSFPFPFKNEQDYASLEIWHAAHGQFETFAPVKTFEILEIEGKDYLLASFTCTPLVLFPLEELKDGNHLKGRTVAELGAGNSPIDIITFDKEGETRILMSNNRRPVMRFKYDKLVSFEGSLTEPVEEFAATEGLAYDNLPLPYVLQLDDYDASKVIYLQRLADGKLILRSTGKKWL